MASDASVTVNRLKIECQVPADVRDANSIANRMTRIARDNLQVALANGLQPLQNGGEEIVLIKNLELELDIDLLLTEQEIAQLWAEKVKKALLNAIGSQKSGATILFASAAHYLGAALLDIARGRARQLWYYRKFNGLWALPVSAALRTALLDNPEQGRTALMHLRATELTEICQVLDIVDAHRILKELFSVASPHRLTVTDISKFTAAVADTWKLALGYYQKPVLQQLLLAMLALRNRVDFNPSVIGTCVHYFSLLLYLRDRHPEDFPDILALLAENQSGQLKTWLSAGQLAALSPLLQADTDLLPLLAEPLLNRENIQYKSEDGLMLANSFTWFGNALLLLPHIDQLSLCMADSWSPLDNYSAASLLRWLVLCSCQGTDKFYAASQDALLRDLCGIGPDISLATLFPWLDQQLSAQRTANLFTQLHKKLPAETTRQYFRWLRDDVRIRVCSDAEKGCWLELAVEQCGEPLMPITPVGDGKSQAHVTADFDSLWLGESFHLSDSSRVYLTILAQFTLKTFAWRLPGFADCSVNYLLQNFLSMSATLVAEEQRINAYLSRVPMSVILNMSGISRGTVQMPNFDEREIRLQETV